MIGSVRSDGAHPMAQSRPRRRKCLCCRAWFIPDPRKHAQQHYCFEKRCRQASKAASQQRWLSKSENEGYFQGPEHVNRVQRRRGAHPGYWRRQAIPASPALQDLIDMQALEIQDQTGPISGALQEMMATLARWRVQRSAAQAGPRGIPWGARRVNQPSATDYGSVQGASS